MKHRILWIATAVIFLVLVIFLDRNSFLDRAQTRREIKELRLQRDYYLNRIAEDSTEMERLKNNVYLERYVRENFLMRADSDVVYILEPLAK